MTASLWDPVVGATSPLDRDLRVDVCVVGGGIAGLSVACELARRGIAVAVLHNGPAAAAGGETARSTAQLVTALDRGYRSLTSMHGSERVALAAQSHAAAIERAEEIIRREHIDCAFSRLDGFLLSLDHTALERELEAARAAGVAVEWAEPPAALLGAARRALRYPRQAQCDPVRFTAGLATATMAAGGHVYSATRATELLREGPSPMVRTAHGPVVTCNAIVLATNAPIAGSLALDAKQAAYRTYVIAARVPRHAVAPALYWDTDDPFHYVRLVPGEHGRDDLLLVGGEDHKTGQEPSPPAERYRRLETWARSWFPSVGDVTCRWSGQVLETMDGLAFIGAIEEYPDVYIVTGDCGDGITHGLIAGMLIPDLIQRRANPWREVYDPRRLRVRGGLGLVRENANVIAQLTSWITPGDVRDEADIAPGSAAVVRRGLRKAAVYRDPSGRLHAVSATCPHLGCVVAWNAAEVTWDCPCHGSRFTPQGRVLNGPANRGLDRLDDTRPAGDEASTHGR